MSKTVEEEIDLTEKPPTWGKSEARKLLCSLLEKDTDGSISGMDVKDVHRLSPLFQPYDVKNFAGYLKTLKNSIANANLPKPPPWKTIKAKETLKLLLECDIDGEIHSMDAAAVQMLSTLFEDYRKTNFKTNLKNLKESIRIEKDSVTSASCYRVSFAVLLCCVCFVTFDNMITQINNFRTSLSCEERKPAS